MESTDLNLYLFKAIESYPYELSASIENLNYALSAEPGNPHALFLLGRVYVEQLGDLEKAKNCFTEALVNKLDMPMVYPFLMKVLIDAEEFDEALNLLDYALKVKGTDKGVMLRLHGRMLDRMGAYSDALSSFKEAKKHWSHSDDEYLVDEDIKRVKKKLPKKKKKKNKGKKDDA